MRLWKEVSCKPLTSLPVKLGWNSTSAQRNRSAPTVMMFQPFWFGIQVHGYVTQFLCDSTNKFTFCVEGLECVLAQGGSSSDNEEQSCTKNQQQTQTQLEQHLQATEAKGAESDGVSI